MRACNSLEQATCRRRAARSPQKISTKSLKCGPPRAKLCQTTPLPSDGCQVSAASHLEAERREVRRAVVVILVFGTLEECDHTVGERRRHDFPSHLDAVIGDHDLAEQRVRH